MTIKNAILSSFKPSIKIVGLGLNLFSSMILAQTTDPPPIIAPIDEFGSCTTPAVMEISPPSAHSLNFGTVNLGKPSSKTVTLKNTGQGPMTLQEIMVSGDSFTKTSGISEECSPSQELAIGQICKIGITFAPSTIGDKEGSLQVSSKGAANAPYLVDLKGKAQGVTVDCLDDNVTLESTTSGPWEQASTWNLNKVPNPSDLVKVNPNHIVEGDTHVKAQCIIVAQGGTLRGRKGSLKVEAGEIYNRGHIFGKEGEDGVCRGPSVSAYQHAKAGGDVFMEVMRLTNDGKIQGGRGGHDITHGDNCPSGQNILARGGQGGLVKIYASASVTNNGTIGSEGSNSYQDGQVMAYGGNGGVGSNYASSFSVCSGPGSGYQLGSGYNYGGAQGGAGGKTVVNAAIRLVNLGRISSGYGGDARVVSGCDQALYGTAGNVVVTSPTLDNRGVISAGESGTALIEPDIMLSGPNMRVNESKNIMIFGGDDWRLSLSNLSEEALRASEHIILAVGRGGTVDLRGNTARIMNAGKKVEIFADNVLLDEGVRMQDLAAAPNIQLHPSKILYAVDISTPSLITGSLGSTLPVELIVLNSGPVEDTYTFTVTDSSGGSLGAVPGEVTVESLQQTELSLNVTLPNVQGATHLIHVKATSKADTSVTSSAEINLAVEEETLPVTPIRPVITPDIVLSAVPCPLTGTINVRCDNHGQVIQDAVLGPSAIVSGGALAGAITNQGFVSQVTVLESAVLSGGTLSGYITNQGTLGDFEFMGASILGGTLSGKIWNTSKVGGTLVNVTFAPGAHLIGGKLQGQIQGDKEAPAELENVRVLKGSELSGVKLGQGVILEEDVKNNEE